MNHASGTFEVKLVPQTDDKNGDAALGRMTIDKQFHGDLEGTSKGQMLTGMTDVKGSAGYVAIEKVSGTLKGRTGTFILQHTGIMNRGVPQLTITVVPDSGPANSQGIPAISRSSLPKASIRMNSSTRCLNLIELLGLTASQIHRLLGRNNATKFRPASKWFFIALSESSSQ